MKPKNLNPITSGAVLLAGFTFTAHAQLIWDPDANQTADGGNGAWDTTSPNWWDGTSPGNTPWDNSGATAARFGAGGSNLSIASGGVVVGDLLIDTPTGTGAITLTADIDGEGPTVKAGGATWDLGGRTLDFVNNNNANDTALFMSSGDTLVIIDSEGLGNAILDTGEKPGGATWVVSGATLDVQDAITLKGNADSIGEFGLVRLVDGSTFLHERNNGGFAPYGNDWELVSGAITFDRRFTNNNGKYILNGIISGTGEMVVDVAGGGGSVLRISNAANSWSGGLTVLEGSTLTVLGSLGDPANLIDLVGVNSVLDIQADQVLDGDILGDGSITVSNGANVDLSGFNEYTGTTTLTGASVNILSSDSLSLDTTVIFNGANPFLNIGADLDGGNPADFTWDIGPGFGEVQWVAGGGFGALGADRTIDIGGAGATLTFGDADFIPDSGALNLQLGSAESTHTTTLVNPVVLPTSGTSYGFRSENGAAPVDGVISGTLSGDGGFQKTGDGVLKLTNTSNSYLGATQVSQGALVVDDLDAIPDLTLTTVEADAALGGDTGSLSVADFDSILADAVFEDGSGLAFDTSSGNFDYPGNLTGPIGVTKIGANTLTLSGTVDYTGPTVIYGGDIVFPGGFLPTGSALTLNDNQIDLGGASLVTGGLASFTDQATVVNSGANADLVFDVEEGAAYTFDGTLGENGGANNDFNIVKRGEGDQFLAETNNYAGTTTLEAGRMDAPRPETFGLDPALTDLNRFTMTGGELRIDVLGANPWSDFTGLSARISGDRDSMLGLNLDLTTQPAPGTWDPGTLTGNHGYRFNAGNTDLITLNSVQAYTGDTELQTGVIVLGADDALSSSAALTIVNNGTKGIVDLNGHSITIAGLSDVGGGGGDTKSLDNDGAGIAVVTLDVPTGEYYNYSRNIRDTNDFIDFVKEGDGTQVFQRGGTFNAVSTEITVNAGTFGLDGGFTNNSADLTVGAAGTLLLDGACGMAIDLSGSFGAGIDGDQDNDGTPDSADPDNVDQTTVGTATVTNTVTFNDGSSFEVEILDWNGGDDLGAVAGTDYDLLVADDLDLSGLSPDGLEIRLGSLVPADFAETNATLVIMQATNAITGFDGANITVDASAFTGTGSWAVVQNGLNIELSYTAGGGDAYDNWALTNITSGPTGFDEDANGDGIANGLNFVLGGDPMVANFAILPQGGESGGDFTFSFAREDDSEGITTQTFRWSTDLVNWNDVAIGATDSGPDGDGVTVGVSENAGAADDISILLPAANAPEGRIFGRFVATRP